MVVRVVSYLKISGKFEYFDYFDIPRRNKQHGNRFQSKNNYSARGECVTTIALLTAVLS